MYDYRPFQVSTLFMLCIYLQLMSHMKANISGANIKKFRKQLELTQIDLAAALNVEYQINLDRSDISEIERGTRGVKDYELAAIAAIFEVSTDELIS